MKKTLSMMLALALLLCCTPTLAEETTEYLSYTNPAGQYSLEYPARYMILDSETVDTVLAATENGKINDNLDVAAYADTLRKGNVTILADPDTGSNVNVMMMDMGLHAPAAFVVQFSLPVTRAQYKTMFPDAVYDDAGSVCIVNGLEFAHLALHYPQGSLTAYLEQYVIYVGNLMYSFSFTYYTDVHEAEMEHVLSTFSTAAE